MSYLDKILPGLPAEIQYAVGEHLNDLHFESARTFVRANERPYSRDIKHPDGLGTCLIKANFTRPTTILEYHLMMYSLHFSYRSYILSHLPGGKLPECTGRKWFGRMKLVEDATIAWNVMKGLGDIAYIECGYSNYREMIRQRALGNYM